jgi:hypothetical protein
MILEHKFSLIYHGKLNICLRLFSCDKIQRIKTYKLKHLYICCENIKKGRIEICICVYIYNESDPFTMEGKSSGSIAVSLFRHPINSKQMTSCLCIVTVRHRSTLSRTRCYMVISEYNQESTRGNRHGIS